MTPRAANVEMLPVATRMDQQGRYRDEISFTTVRGTQTFDMLHLPSVPARAGLVICHPILMEHIKNYRHEVLFGRELARRGVAVQRFHYRGMGHSEGEESELSLATMVEDTLAAAERLRQRTGVASVAFLGTRWGARVAACAIASYPGAAIILWDPVVDSGRYFRELIRARLIREMKDAGADRRRNVTGAGAIEDVRVNAWMDEMFHEGRADILGYPLYRRLFEDGRGPGLDEMLASGGPRTVLLVRMGRRATLGSDVARLKEVIVQTGGTCDVRFIREEPAWLFAGHRMKSVDKLVRESADWLVANVGRNGRG